MKCQRCGIETNVHIMSMFNKQDICMGCKEKERNHPLYKKANDKVVAEEKAGNLNYEGIGLPEDLK